MTSAIRNLYFCLLIAILSVLGAYLSTTIFGIRAPALENHKDFLIYLMIAPLLEEYLFRVGVQSYLSRKLTSVRSIKLQPRFSSCITIFLSAAVFAAVHAIYLIPDFSVKLGGFLWIFPGLALAAAWELSKRLWPCVVLHAWFNFCLLLFSLPHDKFRALF